MKTIYHRFLAAVAAVGMAATGIAADDVSMSDKEFMKNASQVATSQRELGQIAHVRGSTMDVRNLGAALVKEHTDALQELAALARSKRVEIDIEPTAGQKHMIGSLDNKTGIDFDKEFREHVSKDHEKAVKVFRDTAKDSRDPDVRAYALKHLAELEKHYSAAMGGPQPEGAPKVTTEARTGPLGSEVQVRTQ